MFDVINYAPYYIGFLSVIMLGTKVYRKDFNLVALSFFNALMLPFLYVGDIATYLSSQVIIFSILFILSMIKVIYKL